MYTYIGLETTSADTDEQNTENHTGDGAALVGDDGGNSGHDEDGVADDVDTQGVVDGHVTSQVLIGDVGTEERHEVLPELVEGGDTESSALAHAQNTGLVGVSTSGGAFRKSVVNEVGD